MTAGTSDNRLLMWFGQSMTYKQIVFDQKYVTTWIFTDQCLADHLLTTPISVARPCPRVG